MLKTHCISQLAAGHGNVVTTESGTGLADDIDFGDDKIADGKPLVLSKPRFGMKRLILEFLFYWRLGCTGEERLERKAGK